MSRSEMLPPRVLVDASNLHVGGGVQVASSLISLFLRMKQHVDQGKDHAWLEGAEYEVSPAVADNLPPGDRERVRVVRRRPLATLAAGVGDRVTGRSRRRDVHFVVFGPHWGPRRAAAMVMGYADVTAIYEVDTGPSRRISARSLRAWGSRHCVQGADTVVVESASFGRAVEAVTGKPTVTVSNTYHQIIDDAGGESEESLPAWPPAGPEELRLCYVTRSYPHKNLAFLPQVAARAAGLGRTLTFVLTLRQDEWDALAPEIRAVSLNLGPVRIGQVSAIYGRSDGAFFPSLLEASSASPIEAMRLGVPLFASDRDFVREVCGEAPFYFSPDRPDEAARRVVEALADPALLKSHVEAGRAVAAGMPGPEVRADQLAEVITTAVGSLP